MMFREIQRFILVSSIITATSWPLAVAAFCATTTMKRSPRHVSNRRQLYDARTLCETLPKDKYHVVDGMECVEVIVHMPTIGSITILEATAESQSVLVDLALEDEIEDTRRYLNAGDPYGAVLWPAAFSVASFLTNNITTLEACSVLELGTGTGLVSMAASLGGASDVLATDYESVPLRLLEYAVQYLNPRLRQTTPVRTALLDMCQEDDGESSMPLLPYADIVVAADVMYEPKTGRALARRAVEALRRGSRVVVGDSPGRAGRAAFLKELDHLGIEEERARFVSVVGKTCSGQRHELICGKNSKSVSETPQELAVDILYLDPATCFR